MFHRASSGLLLLLCLLLSGCGGHDAGFPGLEQKPEIVKGSGTVVFQNVEGGCWTILADTGDAYEPVGLSDDFKKDGLRVQFTLRTLDVATICMVGSPVEVMDLHLLITP